MIYARAKYEGFKAMASKIAAENPHSFVVLSGNEAVARGAIEAKIKVAASYPGTPSTEILEAIAEVAKVLDIHAEWSVNEIVATSVAAGASMTGVRSIVSMKHVGLNVASDAVMTLAYTGVLGGMVIVVCDDPAMHSSQNEQDTRFFSVHSNLPILDAGNPQEALDMTRAAFELSEELELPVIVRLTTRVSHAKARVRIGETEKLKRKAEFDKKRSRWVMVPSNAIKRHKVLLSKMAKAQELVNDSKFNILEDNEKEVGIIGSGVAYYYARSILEPSQFSWLKLGWVNPFPKKLVKKFTSKVEKIVVLEELRPYIEVNLRCLNIKIYGKEELGLEEIGEFSPDTLRAAFSRIGLSAKPEETETIDLPPRPPVLCPGCPHRAFYYTLNNVCQFVSCDPSRCVGCDICEYLCSWEKEGVFNPIKSKIRAVRIDQTKIMALACRQCKDAPCISACPEKALEKIIETGVISVNEDKCNGCGWCLEACDYGAITIHPDTQKVSICDTCQGDPECVKWCPEKALRFEGKTTDKIVTGDIGCYTLGVLPPMRTLHTCLCMGAGISQAAGMVHAGVKDKSFAVIGDSTFFHAGMPALLNIAYNKANVCVVIMDNRVVAMTGHQPTPGSGKNAVGDETKIIGLEDLARSLGIEKVEIVDPFDIEGTTKVIRDILDYHGPSVIISERPCPLKIAKGAVREVLDECNSCGECVQAFGCPAISLDSDGAEIDPTLCYGCGVCQSICPYDAIGSTE